MLNRMKQNNIKIYDKVRYPILLISVLVLFFLGLELKYPYIFLSDDNNMYWLPALAFNYDSLLKGEFPIYNFHQFLGYPWLSNGQTMVLYPFGYLTTFLSKVFFGHYFATIDIFTITHLLVAAVVFYVLLKFLGLNEKSSVFGAISWVINCFVIYGSIGWVFLSAHAIYFPLMIYFDIKLFKKFNYKDFSYLVICRVLLFFVGHPQYFVYSVIFEILTISLILIFKNIKHNKRELLTFLKVYICSFLFTFLLSLPLLLPMWHQMNISSGRSTKLSFEEFSSWMFNAKSWIAGFFYPFSDNGLGIGQLNTLNYISYIGYLNIFFIFICTIRYFNKEFTKNKRIIVSSLIISGIIIFLWMTSKIFNHFVYLIPILNRFRWPFKLDFYLNFYLIVIASIGFHEYINNLSKKIKKVRVNLIFIILIAVHIIDFSYLYMIYSKQEFSLRFDSIPYEEKLSDKFVNSRVIGMTDIQTYSAMPFWDYVGADFASQWGLYTVGGYEPLISETNNFESLNLNQFTTIQLYKSLWTNHKIEKYIDYLREWGVKWYIVNKESTLKDLLPFEKFYEDDNRMVYLDKQASPFFYWKETKNDSGINASIRTNSIDIMVNSANQDELTINFLYNPFFKASLDNKKVEIRKNDMGQMVIRIPKGNHNISIRYTDPYFVVGCCVTFSTLLLIIIVFSLKKLKITTKLECQ